MNERDPELVALRLIHESNKPVGAAALSEIWQVQGIDRAEATAGRFLRQLDARGLTSLESRTKGRVLTDNGLHRLEELIQIETAAEANRDLQRALEVTSRQELVDLLEVRKLVECETVRRAAMFASEEEIAELFDLACADVGTPEPIGHFQHSMNFHLKIAQISHSPLLQAVMGLLLDPTRDSLEITLSTITNSKGLTRNLHIEHDKIARLVRSRDAENAVRAMKDHFDGLIMASKSADLSLD